MFDKLMKISEACHLLGISQMALYRRCRNGTIPSVKLGRTYYLSLATVQGLLDRAGSTAEAPK